MLVSAFPKKGRPWVDSSLPGGPISQRIFFFSYGQNIKKLTELKLASLMESDLTYP